MSKISKLRELLKAKLKRDISRGNVNEGWFENWMGNIFDDAKLKQIKHDPHIKKLKKKLTQQKEDLKKDLVKDYGSWEKVPAAYKTLIEK